MGAELHRGDRLAPAAGCAVSRQNGSPVTTGLCRHARPLGRGLWSRFPRRALQALAGSRDRLRPPGLLPTPAGWVKATGACPLAGREAGRRRPGGSRPGPSGGPEGVCSAPLPEPPAAAGRCLVPLGSSTRHPNLRLTSLPLCVLLCPSSDGLVRVRDRPGPARCRPDPLLPLQRPRCGHLHRVPA